MKNVKFFFNSGEVKLLDKPLANLLTVNGAGYIEGHKEFTPEAEPKKVPSNKVDKAVQKRKTK